MAKILLLEDEETLRYAVGRALERAGHEVESFDRTAPAAAHLRTEQVQAVLTDVNLAEGDDGIEFAKAIRAEGFEGPIVVMTGYGSIESAVAAMKSGVDDYLQKPVVLEELVLLLDRLLDTQRMKSRVRLYERLEQVRAAESSILGESAAWQQTMELAQKMALASIPTGRAEPGEALPTILLLGETGTGKGVLARYIHDCALTEASTREPFVHVNCTALPPTLIESELFGHEKGAFTDAKTAREGLFEMADGGTIFLDEIGDMPLALQTKILTVVEEGRYRRVGGSKERRVRARIIAATNIDIEQSVKEGAFRSDLYYRLSAFTVRIPALREREGDAVLIAAQNLARFARQFGSGPLSLAPDAEEAIRTHSWPGNVRELINTLQRAALLASGGEITAVDLGLKVTADQHHPTTGESAPGDGRLRFDFESGEHTADSVERELIVQALEYTGGNVSRAARLLHMQRSSLRYRIERFDLDARVREIAQR
ncbi:Response regulator of zinc sigma-54-dependent two-component system [hydrothermal vent metagenome]|uniref:Response regulator of zinc sigma-54-dependent two-component system n=1 Tax=hydrothermal vent metagenome TaxID=652676 RepID=A0A3B1DLI1_9ZZZZ